MPEQPDIFDPLRKSLVEGFGPRNCKRRSVLPTYQYQYVRTPEYKAKQEARRKTSEYQTYQQQYHQTEKYKNYEKMRSLDPARAKYMKKLQQTEDSKESRRVYAANFRKRPEYRAYQQAYDGAPQRKEIMRAYRKLPHYKDYRNSYQNSKYREDEKFRVDRLLRNSLGQALRIYTSEGKIMSSKKYGIDYRACVEHLGDRPDNEHRWVIDHIRPCCSFDLTDPKQVKACFSPQNLRWLTAEENTRKGLMDDKKLSINRRCSP